jgi:hypothetical protein
LLDADIGVSILNLGSADLISAIIKLKTNIVMKKSVLTLLFGLLSYAAITCSATVYAGGITDYYSYVHQATNNWFAGSCISILMIDTGVTYGYLVTSNGSNASCGDASIN